jgi:hypothetical protein
VTLEKCETLLKNKLKSKRTWDMTQIVEHFVEDLNSILRTAKNKTLATY